MPKCTCCGKHFSATAIIEDKRVQLRRRTRCLDCVPYIKKEVKLTITNMKDQTTCSICGRVYVYIRGSGHSKTKCNSCKVNIRRFEKKLKAIAYLGGSCRLCGYSACNSALEFHHKDAKHKEFQISGNHARKWETIQAELDKCVLLCCRCHREVHEGLSKI